MGVDGLGVGVGGEGHYQLKYSFVIVNFLVKSAKPPRIGKGLPYYLHSCYPLIKLSVCLCICNYTCGTSCIQISLTIFRPITHYAFYEKVFGSSGFGVIFYRLPWL